MYCLAPILGDASPPFYAPQHEYEIPLAASERLGEVPTFAAIEQDGLDHGQNNVCYNLGCNIFHV
jgi:hypothetical protein